ncbi:rhodanese-like domain-containing protein [Corynebacterium guangdongense]|uniref:Rhodanese-related sulfurtransferase n=1 Tax=Corynebacterium guangdongense TaxID=1783348 RepID=A0ABU1ZU11_9CORY|nr:rhodanese-like domain-containing protein [Corynebacterium guangdongense]MDR7328360.1 rhodanese-related sulfurtransferase [Corynebacterium guangdongense]WJZ16937.1 Inner membrane protein YgaP [Corynebacterium guangdongense]
MTNPAITALQPADLKERLANDEKIMVIDVRTPAEFETVHIKGAYNVPLSMLSEHTKEFAGRFADGAVLVCQSGARAEQARERLAAVGLETTTILAGGTDAYEKAGGDVVRGNQRWDMNRQVRMGAGSLVLAGFVGSRVVSRPVGFLSAAVGAGLVWSAVSNSCMMATVLSKAPWNKASVNPTLEATVRNIPTATGSVTVS